MDVLAVSINVEGLRNIVLTVLGTLFIIILVVRIFNHWTKNDWGKLVGEIVLAVIVAMFVYFPDTTLELIKGISGGLVS